MPVLRTRGQDAAVAAILAMIGGVAPHAVILTGAAGLGKTTLAIDLAAGLMCVAPEAAAKPCGGCRSCRLVERSAHPDLHRLAPDGAGRQIVIGRAEDGTGVRGLIAALSLLPVEGPARVAVIEDAHRLNEDAQNALLKTLEEPPAGLTLILCADDEALLLPTIRSRCARVRLAPVGSRDVEAILAERTGAEPALAARLARLSGGRPGTALAYAHAPDAVRAQGELVRVWLDAISLRPSARLASIRAAVPIALGLVEALEAGAAAANRIHPGGDAPEGGDVRAKRPSRPARARAVTTGRADATVLEPDPTTPGPIGAEDADDVTAEPARDLPPSRRRRASEVMLTVAIEVARDLALARIGALGGAQDPDLFDEIRAAASDLPDGAAAVALRRSERAGAWLSANVNPDLLLDDLVLAWPRPASSA